MSISDADAIKRIKNGYINDFSYIVSKYSGMILKYVRAKLFNKNDVDDIVQNIFISFYKSIRKFDESRPIGPYIYQIARNELKMYYRSHKSMKSLEDYHESMAYEQQFFQDDYSNVKKSLTSEQKKIIELLEQGYTYQEIAEKISRPINTVRTIIRRTRFLLKKRHETT